MRKPSIKEVGAAPVRLGNRTYRSKIRQIPLIGYFPFHFLIFIQMVVLMKHVRLDCVTPHHFLKLQPIYLTLLSLIPIRLS